MKSCYQLTRSRTGNNNSHKHNILFWEIMNSQFNFCIRKSEIKGIWGINFFLRWVKNRARNKRIPWFDTSWSLAVWVFERIMVELWIILIFRYAFLDLQIFLSQTSISVLLLAKSKTSKHTKNINLIITSLVESTVLWLYCISFSDLKHLKATILNLMICMKSSHSDLKQNFQFIVYAKLVQDSSWVKWETSPPPIHSQQSKCNVGILTLIFISTQILSSRSLLAYLWRTLL